MTEAVFTQPQIAEHYGSIIILPGWLRASRQTVMVIDATAIEQGLFAFYHKGDVSRRSILNELEAIPSFPVSVYAFGRDAPLDEPASIPPVLGGLVKVVPSGTEVVWATRIQDRLSDPLLWDPDEPHVGHHGGSHFAFQAEDRQILHAVHRGDGFTPLSVACELFDTSQHSIWVRAPTHRPRMLYWKGRRAHSVIAVIDAEKHPPTECRVIVLDLRGLGLWPTWIALREEAFFPGDVIEALNIQHLPGFSVVVKGGRKGRTPGLLFVSDGEVLGSHCDLLRPLRRLRPAHRMVEAAEMRTTTARATTAVMWMTMCLGPGAWGPGARGLGSGRAAQI